MNRIVRPGGIAGAVSIAGPTYRIDAERAEQFGRILSDEARILSEQFSTPQLEST